ncbi:MAG TPA: hypothetical protein VGC61_10170 [Pyrinomonadaceae bacterium]|jgi:hypothetical protein
MTIRVSLLALVLSVCLLSVPVRAKPSRGNLRIYFIDSEGGAATLIVTPARESVLLDAGWDTPDGRDAKRIQQAMQLAE